MMITRCLARRPSTIQSAVGAWRRTSPRLSRSLYKVPALDNHEKLERDGVPGLFSKESFKMAYTDYQQYMVDELNVSTAQTTYENQEIKSLVIDFARDPTKAYAFNIASMAYNNNFFFGGLNTDPDVKSQPSANLQMQINKDFSSTDTLRETFLATAEVMFGPGFVWLVQTNNEFRSLRILPTYLAGSPLSGAHYRRQSHNLNTHNADSYQALNKVGQFGVSAGQDQRPKAPLGGVDVVPLMCVNTWEHVWLLQYGIRGKREYLERWWDRINWSLVEQNATISSRGKYSFQGA